MHFRALSVVFAIAIAFGLPVPNVLSVLFLVPEGPLDFSRKSQRRGLLAQNVYVHFSCPNQPPTLPPTQTPCWHLRASPLHSRTGVGIKRCSGIFADTLICSFPVFFPLSLSLYPSLSLYLSLSLSLSLSFNLFLYIYIWAYMAYIYIYIYFFFLSLFLSLSKKQNIYRCIQIYLLFFSFFSVSLSFFLSLFLSLSLSLSLSNLLLRQGGLRSSRRPLKTEKSKKGKYERTLHSRVRQGNPSSNSGL